MSTNEEDFVEHLISMNTHDYILFFSNRGRVYRMKGYEIPEYSIQSKGLTIINLLPLEKDENISSIVSIKENDDFTKYLMFATREGIVKRTPVEEFDSIRKSGKIAIVLKENDELISEKKTCGKNEIVIGASNGRMVRFDEDNIRSMGRTASGVKSINVDGGEVVGVTTSNEGKYILVLTEKGLLVGKKNADKVNGVLNEIGADLTEAERDEFYRSLTVISESLDAVAKNAEK